MGGRISPKNVPDAPAPSLREGAASADGTRLTVGRDLHDMPRSSLQHFLGCARSDMEKTVEIDP